MVRYRLVEQGRENQPRVSWIKIPLIVNGRNQAYFIVMESREFLDYYDEYSIRIAFILLQSVYEQMVVAQMTGDIGFENFIHFVVNSEESEIGNAIYRANVQGIYFLEQYIYIMFRQTNEAVSSKVQRRILERLFRKCFVSADNRLAFLDENEGMLFLDAEQWKKSGKEELRDYLIKFQRLICEQFPEMKMEFAILNTPTSINELKYNIEKCKRVLDMGEIICPKQNIWDYETLGPLVWLQIPEKELQDMLVGYKALLKDEKNVELLLTLKIYLENNMNFSVTAEKMYVHINTIRKRIEKINDFLNLDFTDPIVRLKTELLLQYMNLE